MVSLLKSTYMHPIFRLEHTLSTYRPEIVLVQLHEPIYPACKERGHDLDVEARKYWVPIFDRFGVQAVFENHSHIYKKSKRLYNDEVSEDSSKGTYYLGEGSWGLLRTMKKCDQDTKILENYSFDQAIWVVELNSSSTLSVKSLNIDNEIIDQFEI